MKVEYLGLPQYPELLKTGQVVRDELKQIGIDMEIKQVDVSGLVRCLFQGQLSDHQRLSGTHDRSRQFLLAGVEIRWSDQLRQLF